MRSNELKNGINFNPLKGKLARKLIFSMVIISSFLAFFITAFQLYIDYRVDVDALSEKLQEIEKSYGESITESVWVLNDEQIIKQLTGIVAIPGLHSASIAVDGVARWVKSPNTNQQPTPSHQYTYQFTLIKQYKNTERNIGTVTLIANTDEIYSSLYNRIALIFSTNIFKTFMVSFFLFFFFNYFITRHLYQLADYAKKNQLHS